MKPPLGKTSKVVRAAKMPRFYLWMAHLSEAITESICTNQYRNLEDGFYGTVVTLEARKVTHTSSKAESFAAVPPVRLRATFLLRPS